MSHENHAVVQLNSSNRVSDVKVVHTIRMTPDKVVIAHFHFQVSKVLG